MTTTTAEFAAAEQSRLHATTLCEAFQTTAAMYPDRVALRTPGDAFVMTWERAVVITEQAFTSTLLRARPACPD